MKRVDDLTKEVGAEVGRRRRNLKLSQEELAFASGLHRTYISLLERGCKSPTISTVASVSQALGISASDLIKAAENAVRELERT